ncbi:MAG: signal peptide peptidase SppA [Acidobacteria bacterium]|nr:signal peptide peptidase SppA [Acidobacteriota bacterium]
MRKFIAQVFATILGVGLFFVMLLFVMATLARPTKGRMPAKVILEANFETAVVEHSTGDPFERLAGGGSSIAALRDIVDALEKGRDDAKVAGFIARIGAAPMSMAQAQEIRDAVTAFRAKNKFAVIFAETFGEFGPGNGAYYLATAFDEIWLQPSGDIGVNGLNLSAMFMKGTLEKLNVVPRMDHRYEYKNAMNQFTEKKFTGPHREAMQSLLDAWFGQLVRGIAEGRKLTEVEVRAVIDRAPLLGQEALQAKLVDGMAYRDEIYEKVKAKASGAELLYLSKYLDRAGRPHDKGPVVALIYGVGAVVRGKSDFNPLQGSGVMGSDTVAAAFRDAIQDKDVKAILFRVDSPGGSYVASDTIYHETLRARKAGKPVIVSMSSVAGSGGYFVAMAADKIVAQPATITGSIGVLGGKLLTNGVWDKVGVSWDEVHAGKNARMFSSTDDFTKEEWARFQAWLDRVYDDFTGKVAEGRKLPKERVKEIAKGRIWSGEDAKKIGLVDELGGYATALKLVKQAAKLDEASDVQLRTYPRKKSTFEALVARFGDEGESSESKQAEVMVRVLEEFRPVYQQMRAMGIVGSRQEVLSMPEMKVLW